jgi:endonuclease/exonuclease/phosphatase (EEP) superfamily protein YafD
MSPRKLIGAAALLALIPSWLGLLGGWSWLLDLLSHFRWQYLLASVVALGWAAWSRQRVVAAAALLTLLLNGALIGRLALHPDVDAGKLAADFSLRVVSLNVLMVNRDKQAALDYLMASDADVITLLEVDQRWVDAMAPLQQKYPYWIAQPRPDNFGIAMYSRVRWEQAQVLHFGLPSIEATMTHQGRRLVVIGTHPMSPGGAALARLRDEQLQWMARHVSQLHDPVLLVGDLNATPWSAGMRIITSGELGLRSLVPAWQPTWNTHWPVAVPIDHALASAPLVITQRAVGPDVGSDHRPIAVTVGWEVDTPATGYQAVSGL